MEPNKVTVDYVANMKDEDLELIYNHIQHDTSEDILPLIIAMSRELRRRENSDVKKEQTV